MSNKNFWSSLAAITTAAGTWCGCESNNAPTTQNIPAVKNFQLAKYCGEWYEIARLPHFFERDLQQVRAHYRLRQNGVVEVTNSGRRNGKRTQVKGVARFKTADTAVGELEVSFWRPFYGSYRVIILEPDYFAAAVTSDTMDYLWILCRAPQMDQGLLKQYLAMLKAWGFPTAKLEYPEQTAVPTVVAP